MLFNTLEFFIFFIIVYALYFVLPHRWQNRMLLAASYVFYGSWDWRFLSLIIISTVLDYFCGLKIDQHIDKKRRKFFLFLSMAGNLSMLGFFKYFNFFIGSFSSLLAFFGIHIHTATLNVILPVGISFYTFQTMSYTIDIYRRRMRPTDRFWDFALFVAFFPQLVAGPIERAKHLLPQMLKKRTLTLDQFYEGCYLIFWGIFQKVFVADNLAKIVDPIFSAPDGQNGLKILLALYAFAFQIFCDFAGYSNIARGLAKVMGFDIMVNFRLPYFATNPQDFWQRWHISLSTWLRDYLYIPLGGNRNGSLQTYRNLALTMLLGGLWHGAGWTFVIWGAYQGFLLIAHRLLLPYIKGVMDIQNRIGRQVWLAVRVVFFFHLTCAGWLIFRAQSAHDIGLMIHKLFFDITWPSTAEFSVMANILFYTAVLLIVQFIQYLKNDLMAVLKMPGLLKAFFYMVCFYLIILYGVTGGHDFIYFQF